MNVINERIQESIDVKKKLVEDMEIQSSIERVARVIHSSLGQGGKILFCGNGGSAADSLHLAGEIVGRFQKERSSMAAVALNADVATMTSIANDYGYEFVFSRMVEGLMNQDDVLVGISTSGNSENVYRAILKAKEMGGCTVAFLGNDGGKIKKIADISIVVPSNCTARIQEAPIMIGHIICELVE